MTGVGVEVEGGEPGSSEESRVKGEKGVRVNPRRGGVKGKKEMRFNLRSGW